MTEVRERGAAWQETADDRHRALGRGLGDRRGMPFLALADPFVGWAYGQLVERLAPRWPGTERLPAPPRWAELLLPALCRRLNGMAQRTCLVELAAARERGQLAGDDGEARFSSFLDWLSTSDNGNAVLARYPLLARQLSVVSRLWTDQAVEFSERLIGDLPTLVERFAAGADPGMLTEVHMGLGDPHRGGRTVCSVRFENGLRCVYKPRSLATDVHFQHLLDWLNARLDGTGLPTIACLDRGDHGWMRFVESAECAPGEPAARLFRRYGALLATLYVVHAGDCHTENIVVSGEHPFLVDIETVFQPRVPTLLSGSSSAAETAAAELCDGSVLFSGLLPTGGRPADATEMAGVGSSAVTPKAGASANQPALVDAGTDRMRIAVGTRQPDAPPRTALRPLDHLGDIEAGFADAYRVFARDRDELAAGPLAAFAEDHVRYVARDTMVYGVLLSTSFHPSLLRDEADRDRHFDRLRDAAARRPGLASFVESERKDLWRNDIPLFTVGVSGGPVRDSDGVPLAGPVRSGMDIAREVVARLGPDDLALQTWLIRTAVTSETIRSELTVARPRHEVRPAERPVDTSRLADAADDIAERVAALAIRADDEAVWLGCSTGRSGDYVVGALDCGFYDGLTGIAAFLAHHGRVRDSRESRRLARAATLAAVRKIDRSGDIANRVGFQGAGGLVHGLAHLHAVLPDDGLIDRALRIAEQLRGKVAADNQFEVMGGAAGAILGLASLHRVRPGGVVRDAIAAAAERLLVTAQPCAAGAGWTPAALGELGVATEPIAGFAHGTSGIAAALAVAADILGDARCEEAMRAALAYEAHLFDPGLGDWRDLRAQVGAELVASEEHRRSVAWCHGAPGIGVARHLVLDVVDEPAWRAELATAAATTLRSGFGSDHSLCHGDLGNLDFLALAARRDASPADAVRRHAAGVLDGAAEHGWRCGLHPGLTAAGLFTGLAGIGYGLLRLVDPDGVPSMVALHPPAP